MVRCTGCDAAFAANEFDHSTWFEAVRMSKLSRAAFYGKTIVARCYRAFAKALHTLLGSGR